MCLVDKNGERSKEYWSSTHEMAARAFSSYIEDTLAEQGRKNDYLAYAADNKFYPDGNPYPEGEERKRINAAFKKLFEVIRENNAIEKAVAIVDAGGHLQRYYKILCVRCERMDRRKCRQVMVGVVPIGGDAREKEGALSLSPDVRAAAEAHGVVCLLDLLPFVSLHKEGRLQAPGDPVGYRLCDEPGGAFPPIEIADPMPPEQLCGEGGVLARLLDGGYGGAFLRYADRFADSFLFAVRAELTARAPTSLFYVCTERGALEGAPVGYRRRFCEPPFDGLVCSSLQEALASYLSRGDTGGLSRFFDGYIGALPAPLAKRSVALLGEPRGRTLHARIGTALPHEEGERADALARLGELIAATLPGLSHLPMPEAGEEERLAFRLRLFGICRKEKAILSGAFRLHILSPELLVFSRTVEGQMLITVCNRSAKTLAISSPDGFSVLIGGRGRKLLYRLPPNSGTILRVDLFAGERTALSFHYLQSVSRDPRFAPRTAGPAEKSS